MKLADLCLDRWMNRFCLKSFGQSAPTVRLVQESIDDRYRVHFLRIDRKQFSRSFRATLEIRVRESSDGCISDCQIVTRGKIR